MQTRIDKFGRVLIPKAIRKNLGLEPGETLQLEQSDKEIILKPKKECYDEQLKIFERLLKYNKNFDLDISLDIDISRLADEVNA